MAVTKIHPIKFTVNKAIAYVTNPKKTDEYTLVDYFGCTHNNPAMDFDFSLKEARAQKNGNKAFHLIQSFVPDETNPEEAHRIGQELCDKLLNGKYTYVIGTHVDKHHIHNHIIFCAVDNINFKKYNDCKATYRNIRQISDKLCHDHNLDVIGEESDQVEKYIYCKEWIDGKPVEITTTDAKEAIKNAKYVYRPEIGFTEELISSKGDEKNKYRSERDWSYFHVIAPKKKNYKDSAKSYKEWLENKGGTSWKSLLKTDINATIKESVNYDNFIEKMRDKGYQIKGEKLDGSDGKYISFLCPGQERWVRGKKTSGNRGLGEDFTREKINERIEKRVHQRAERIKTLAAGTEKKALINTSDDKFANNAGLKRWAEKENLKRMSALYSELNRMGLSSKEALFERIATLEQSQIDADKELDEIQEKMKVIGKVGKAVSVYQSNKKYYTNYQNSKDQERYLENRLSEITLFQDAEQFLKNSEIEPDKIDLSKLREEYNRLEAQKESLTGRKQKNAKEINTLNKYYSDLQAFISGQQPEKEQNKEQNKDKNTTR